MTQTKVVLVTLLPTEPRDPGAFHDDIANLKIEVFDLTVKDSKNGVQIGVAEKVAQDPFVPIKIEQTNPPKLKTAIFQHFKLTPKIPPPTPPISPYTWETKSVATAAIIVNIPSSHSEFDSLDLRIILTRGTDKISKLPPLEFNAPVRTLNGPLPTDPHDWIGLSYPNGVNFEDLSSTDEPIWRAAYVFVPPVPRVSSSRPGVNFSADRVTPVFDDFLTSVNKVLEDDHTSTDPATKTSLQERASPLDPVQSLQVARELVFNRITLPLPAPKKKTLENMYGNPNVASQDDQERKEFEANLTAYHSQHDAEALQLATFVYALSAAVECEKLSLLASSAGFTFDVVADRSQPKLPFPTKSVLLQGTGDPPAALSLTFGVPAAFYFALGCSLPTDVTANDRYTSASIASESAILKTLQAAIDNGIVKDQESAVTNSTNEFLKDLFPEQAARRLSALGATKGNQIAVLLDASMGLLVGDWLKFAGDSSAMSEFWISESKSRPGEYLDLVLDAIVEEQHALKAEIKSGMGVNSTHALASVTDKGWRDFWQLGSQTRVDMLPGYTLPGSLKQRVEAFIKHIVTLFSLRVEVVPRDDQAGDGVKTFSRPGHDILQMFLDAIPGFTFALDLDPNAISNVLNGLPINEELREWAKKALDCIPFLYKVTTFPSPNTEEAPSQFSLMESLYARGLINKNRVTALTKPQFRAALAGTVAHRESASGAPLSDLIHDFALQMHPNVPSIGPDPEFSFSPVNPGQLVDCRPPDHLSPFGLNMYLSQLLSSYFIQNCNRVALQYILQTRCGPLSELEVSPANLKGSLPLIDIVNESLEALVEQASTGSERRGLVYNMDETAVGNLKLGTENGGLDPAEALLAIPQHSTPQLINTTTKAYEVLRSDISAPCLPYDQELDINRSYLSSLRVTRFNAMRKFRKDITEFVLCPTPDPVDFQSSVWRYPVRLEIASEYLNISDHERQLLFAGHDGSVGVFYGFSAAEKRWSSLLSSLLVFLERTGLSYCEFYALWKTRFFSICRVLPSRESESMKQSGAQPNAEQPDVKQPNAKQPDLKQSDVKQPEVQEPQVKQPDANQPAIAGHESIEYKETDNSTIFPECEPCCLESFKLSFGDTGRDESVLYQIAVFIRLWRKVESHYGTGNVSVAVFANICRVIKPFVANGKAVDPDFIRQVVALFMLCDEFGLPLCEETSSPCPNDRTTSPHDWVPILALWSEKTLQSRLARRAVKILLSGIEQHGFSKILDDDLCALAELAGFTSDNTWHSKPTCTLRFAEILSKIYVSPFTVGEILFLFNNRCHRSGDDPFPYTEKEESKDDPLNVPEDEEAHGLWELRRKLLNATIDDEEVNCWSWQRIDQSLRNDFGFPSNDFRPSDTLTVFAEHFFPHVLQFGSCPCSVAPERRRFYTDLYWKDTNADLWNSAPCEPFHYSPPRLWTELPLRDEDVIRKLAHIRQLSEQREDGRRSEIDAVRQLYFAPRVMLAPFTSIFGSLAEAIDAMVQEACDRKRFAYFQKSFAIFHKRCEIITQHLLSHIHQVLNCKGVPVACDNHLAWKVLRHIIADENNPQKESWEKDSGEVPDKSSFPWDPTFTGGAFAALLGLTGTGVEGTFMTTGDQLAWKEIRGPFVAFGDVLNEKDIPVPTVLPSLNRKIAPEQRLSVLFRNGLAIDGTTAEHLGGAQPFRVGWKGALLVERSGQYRFSVHRPCAAHGSECSHGRDCCDEARWTVHLRRGQKHWVLVDHDPDAHESAHQWHSHFVCLSRGAYDIKACLEQPQPDFKADEVMDRPYTGFAVQYCGPDTNEETQNIPLDKLFLESKHGRFAIPEWGLIAPTDQNERPNMLAFLDKQYVSSLRDIRRTYQRAFKALLFAKRFCLSAEEIERCHGQCELGFLLSHPTNFQGTSYYPVSEEHSNVSASPAVQYKPHHADFDFNFLPVGDAYYPPSRDEDNRAEPSIQRSSALFDWWERVFDYRRMAAAVEQSDDCYRPVWRLFYEAATQQPRDAASLVRLLGVESKVAPLVLKYFEGHDVSVPELVDERWPIRVWHSWRLVQCVEKALYSKNIHQARHDLWAATSPSSAVDAQSLTPNQTGNQNLIDFVSKSLLLDHDEPQYRTIKKINNGLRVRANQALLAFLTRLDHLPLAFQHTPGDEGPTPSAKSSADVSAFLLQDVSPSLCQLSTRTSHAISCIQTLIQRIRLALEPSISFSFPSEKDWDHMFGTFEDFGVFMRRVFYSENWVQWEELCVGRNSEAYRFFEDSLKTHTLSMPKTSPPFTGVGNTAVPPTGGLLALQAADVGVLRQSSTTLDEGVSPIGAPLRSALPSWLSNAVAEGSSPAKTDGDVGLQQAAIPTSINQVELPMWFQAAVRLGTAFIRVAAASIPPAMMHSWDEDGLPVQRSCPCEQEHVPVMDEYYFWLEKGEFFNADNATQDANIGVRPPDPTSDWERPSSLPKMLHWPTQPLVYLHWTRIHCGEFSPPRRSNDGVPYNVGSERPELSFGGREHDSLLFGLVGSSTKGFRYDIVPDTAIALPQITANVPPDDPVPAPLSAYPFFIYFEPGAPIAPVSTFGTALAIAGSLRTQCRFEEALKWCRAAFDPLQRENTWAQCQRKKPIPNLSQTADENAFSINLMKRLPETPDPNGPCCTTSPVLAGIARPRAALLEYLNILLQWGDSLLCRGTYESRRQASILFDEAIRLLGPKPSVIKASHASQIHRSEDIYNTVGNFKPSAAPLNSRLIEIYERAYDKKDLLYRCSNAQRLSIRPEAIISCSDTLSMSNTDSVETCDCGSGQGQCCFPYKFSYLLPKAQELVSVLKVLGGAILTAIEKGDSEYLASIRQAQEHQMNHLVLSNRQNSYRESDWQVQALEQQLQGALTRLRYFQQLIKNDLNQNEHLFLSATEIAMQLRVAGNVSEAIGQGMNFIPDITLGGAGFGGSPVAINELPIGTKLAQVFQAASRILNIVGDVQNTTAGKGSTRAGWDRRLEEWEHQVNVTTIEIAQIKRQQLGAQRRRDVSLKELNNHKVQMENSAEVDSFMRDKMTKQDLYLFMQQQTAQLHRRTFDLAWETVREAQAALTHERPELRNKIIAAIPQELGPAGWDGLHSGLLAGERLEFALHALDRMYMREAACREYELSKHISLRLHLPLAFLQLKTLGYCEFELPEWMFDLDYPGHYLRRIKNVSVTIPCIVGPYVGIHCRLQLLSSGIRLVPTLPTAPKCCCQDGPRCIKPLPKGSCGTIPMASWISPCAQPQPICTSAYTDPETLQRNFLSSEAIATSTGQNDSGVFELSFKDDKMRAPFEFAGVAASRWRVELPPRNNAFDLESLTDFVLHINYTAKEGGAALRDVADRAALKRLPGDGLRFFDVRSEFASAWSSTFAKQQSPNGGKRKGKHHGHGHDASVRKFPLQFARRAFPFLTGRRSVIICGIDIFVETERPCDVGEHFLVTFKPVDGCKDDWKRLKCTASCQTPGFFHGELRCAELGPLCGDGNVVVGDLEIPSKVVDAGVRQMYFLCQYEVFEDGGREREGSKEGGIGGKKMEGFIGGKSSAWAATVQIDSSDETPLHYAGVFPVQAQ